MHQVDGMSNTMVLFMAQSFPITKTRQKNQDAWKKWNSERGISYGRTTKPMSIKKTSTTSSRSTRPAPPRKNVSQNPFSYDYGTSYSTTEKAQVSIKQRDTGVNTTGQSSRLRLQRKSQSFPATKFTKKKTKTVISYP